MKHRTSPTEPSTHEVVDALLDVSPDASLMATHASVVAECVSDRHPTLQGRILVRLVGERGTAIDRWVPTLHGLPVREGDRVLLTKPVNFGEPVVVGVLDGFSKRPVVAKVAAATVAIRRDETVRVETHEGVPLLELYESEGGPVVRLVHADVDIEVKGSLRLSAARLELVAREGEARLSATDDVVVSGENIQLN
jgi:hypothetical protein